MPPLPAPMPSTRHRHSWLLLVLGSGVASGLHLGLLHLFLWRSPAAPLVFLGGSLVLAVTAYLLLRFAFPRVAGPSAASQALRQGLLATGVFLVVSVAMVGAVAQLLGEPGLFGTPAGPAQQIVVTPETRQAFAWLYALSRRPLQARHARRRRQRAAREPQPGAQAARAAALVTAMRPGPRCGAPS